ncbi:hypothetical protein S886_24490 [Salmonella enterica subsp. arizonae]|nr:hypothetical protein [Salmonella enterica subsp. arizonae]
MPVLYDRTDFFISCTGYSRKKTEDVREKNILKTGLTVPHALGFTATGGSICGGEPGLSPGDR